MTELSKLKYAQKMATVTLSLIIHIMFCYAPAAATKPQVAAGSLHTVGLKSDGTVVAVGQNNVGQCDVSSWTGIQQVAAGYAHTVGLKTDGTVVAVGDVGQNDIGQNDVHNWSDIQQVTAGYFHTVGLKSDGTVVAVGYNEYGQCDVSSWTGIQQVAAGGNHTVGLKSDGTVVAVGQNNVGQCDVSSWTGIQQVAAGYAHTVGLKTDGTVVAVGYNYYGQSDLSSWTGIQQVASLIGNHTVGLKSDGTVVAVGRKFEGQCDVSSWTGIQQVTAGYFHTVGLKSDGTVVAVGYNEYGQCDVSGWNLGQPTIINQNYRGLYVDGFEHILGNPDKENELLNFAKLYDFQALTLYHLNFVLPTYAEKLSAFIFRARNDFGIKEIGAAGSTEKQFDDIISFNNKNYKGKFDTLTTEYEFWDNEGGYSFNDFVILLDHIKVNNNQNLIVEAYIGWFDKGLEEFEAEQMIRYDRVDRIFLHCYVKNPNDAFSYGFERLKLLGKANQNSNSPLNIRPIFSAEYLPPDTNFMGCWLKRTHNDVDGAEKIFMDDYDGFMNQVGPKEGWENQIKINGFVYFAYSFLFEPKCRNFNPSIELLLNN